MSWSTNNNWKKIFDGRSASGQKAASMSTLRNNTTTSNDVFDPRLANSAAEPDVENDTQEDNSYLERIDKEFGPLSEEEESVEETENRPRAKKAKIHHNAGPSSKDQHQSTDDTSSQTKSTKKKNVGLELANQMKEWREHREKEFEQRELAKLSPEAQVMRNIQEHYSKEVEKLPYEEYSQLVLLLRKPHDEVGGYTGAEYYTMMDGRNAKFRDELMKKWVEKIKSQLKSITPSLSE